MKQLLLTLLLLYPILGYTTNPDVTRFRFYKISDEDKKTLYYKVANAFISSKHPSTASEYITEHSRTEAQEFQREYRTLHQSRTGTLRDDLLYFSKDENEFAFITQDTQSGDPLMIQLIWNTDQTEPKVDWKATYAYEGTTWEEFLHTRPQTPTTMKLRLSRDTYYNFNFKDETTWICLKCNHPFLKTSIYAYIKREDPNFEELFKILQKTSYVDVTANVCYSEEIKDPKQIEITKIIRNSWLSRTY